MANNIKVSLAPQPGFCIKTSCLQDGAYVVPPTEEGPGSTIAVPNGTKVFINVCYDSHVPPPPIGSEDIIQRAMQGEELPGVDGQGPEWFIPVVVSHAREVTDKAGKPSVVFDCIIHSSIKERVKDPEFKIFLQELALQRIEARSFLPVSRTIGTPNIRSKGVLLPRTVLIPPSLYPEGDPIRQAYDAEQANKKSKKLIEEIRPDMVPTPSKGILKKTHVDASSATKPIPLEAIEMTGATPAWTWSRDDTGFSIKIQVPDISRTDIPQASLDLEGQRLILSIPGKYSLDIDRDLSDADIQKQAKTALAAVNAAQWMALKRNPHDFDVDGAKAEWRVSEGVLVVHA